MPAESGKNPGLAAVFSFVFSGLGQLYNGQILKGLWIIFFSVVSILIFIAGAILLGFYMTGHRVLPAQAISGTALCVIGLAAICILGIFSIVDAHQVAQRSDH